MHDKPIDHGAPATRAPTPRMGDPDGGGRWFRRRATRRMVAMFIVAAFVVVALMRFGGRLLVVDDPLPRHVDVAIVLNGSEPSVSARFGGAMELMRQGRVEHVLLSVGAVRYYGEWLPDLVRRYLLREFGDDVGDRVTLCEGNADSTREEMGDLRRCLRDAGWASAVVVTSNFHTRRTRMLVEELLVEQTPVRTFAVYGVSDGSFEPQGWWRHRRYAKTWFLEMTKLIFFFFEQMAPASFVDG